MLRHNGLFLNRTIKISKSIKTKIMKKLAILIMALISLTFVSATIETSAYDVEISAPQNGFVKVVNDTKNDVMIHTGGNTPAHTKLSRGGGSTSIACDNGRKVSFSNGNKATELIFKIDDSMCGKTVKLSQYIK
jgi:hypothetical protein